MAKAWKKPALALAIALLVGASVYLNWKYSDNVAQTNKVLGEAKLVSGETELSDEAEALSDPEGDYFATARLSRKQARDSAINMLHEAEIDENATEDVLNEASETLQVLAGYTVAEAQIESLVMAKGYTECVAFMGADSISVVVSDPDGLDTADVARIKDIVVSETSYKPEQIKIMEAD